MEDLWKQCEEQKWSDWGAVERLIHWLEEIGAKDRAREARHEYTKRHGPPTEDLFRYTHG